MTPSQDAIHLITCAEGFCSTPYLDTSHIYTVGWGYALKTPGGQNIDVDVFHDKALGMAQEVMQRKFGSSSISEATADACLMEEVKSFGDNLSRKLPADTTQHQFDALLSFDYNVGPGNFDGSAVKRLHLAGNRTVGNLSLIQTCQASKAKQDPTTISLAFARWSNSGGVWTLGLFRRRIAEVLVYSGWEASKAITAAWQFHD